MLVISKLQWTHATVVLNFNGHMQQLFKRPDLTQIAILFRNNGTSISMAVLYFS